MQNIVIKLNHTVTLAQDSYYTQNPVDKVNGLKDIGPECPSSVTFTELTIRRHYDPMDGDVYFELLASHTWNGWEIYSDTAVGPELTKVLKKVLPDMFENRTVHFSEQGLQDYGLAHFDIIDEDGSTDFVDPFVDNEIVIGTPNLAA